MSALVFIRRFVAIMVCLSTWQAMTACSEISAADRVFFLQNAKKDYLKTWGSHLDPAVLGYFDNLETNWPDGLAHPVSDTNGVVNELQGLMQFYLFGKKDYEQATLKNLLNPVIPLKSLRSDGRSNGPDFLRSDLDIHFAWFRLLNKLQFSEVVKQDPGLVTVGGIRQFLQDLNTGCLLEKMTDSDFDLMMKTCDSLPDFSDSYVQKLADLHDQNYPGIGHFAHLQDGRTRFQGYQQMVGLLSAPDYTLASAFLKNTLDGRPDLLAGRMSALNFWIEAELNDLSTMIQSAPKAGAEKDEMLSYIKSALDASLAQIQSVRTAQTVDLVAGITNRFDASKIALVTDLSRYSQFNGQRFDANFLPQLSGLVTILNNGNLSGIVAELRTNRADYNLTVPVSIISDFVKRYPTDEFQTDANQICARLEGLQDSVNKMKMEN